MRAVIQRVTRAGVRVDGETVGEIGKGLLWDLSAPPGTQPLELRRNGSWQFAQLAVHPKSDWAVATAGGGSKGATFWPLRKTYPSVVEGASSYRKGLAFSPDGTRLASSSVDGTTRVYAVDVDDLVALARSRLTRWFTPADRAIHGEGLAPDIDVEMPLDPDAIEEGLDPQLDRAIEYLLTGQ